MKRWTTHIHTTLDARGRRVVLYNPRSVPRAEDPLLAAGNHTLFRLAKEQAGYRLGFFAGCASVAVVLIGQGILVPLRHERTDWLVVGLWIGMLAFVAIFMRVRSITLSRRIVSEMHSLGCCPSCGYKLSGLKADADGLTTCPECGCTWSAAAAG